MTGDAAFTRGPCDAEAILRTRVTRGAGHALFERARACRAMITLRVFKTPAGWSIAGATRMSTVFLSLKVALEQANAMAEILRRHGETVVVQVDQAASA